MAVEAQKVLAALELKLKGKSVSKNFKKAISEKWAPKIENDEAIDGYVEDREDILIEASAETDRIRLSTKKETEKELAKRISGEQKTDDDPEEDPSLDPTMPAWAKALYKQNQELKAEVTGFKSSQTAQTIAERFKKDERLKNVPEFGFKGRIPTKEEDFEAFATELAEDYKGYVAPGQQQQQRGTYSDRPRLGGAGSGVTPITPASQEEAKVPDAIKAFTATLNKSNNSQTKS